MFYVWRRVCGVLKHSAGSSKQCSKPVIQRLRRNFGHWQSYRLLQHYQTRLSGAVPQPLKVELFLVSDIYFYRVVVCGLYLVVGWVVTTVILTITILLNRTPEATLLSFLGQTFRLKHGANQTQISRQPLEWRTFGVMRYLGWTAFQRNQRTKIRHFQRMGEQRRLKKRSKQRIWYKLPSNKAERFPECWRKRLKY